MIDVAEDVPSAAINHIASLNDVIKIRVIK